MKLRVLGSSSSGNCYLLENKDECLILEAGVKYKSVQNVLSYDVGKISGCLITHEHGDHSKYVNEFMSASIDVYASAGTWDVLGVSGHRMHILKPYEKIKIGKFIVLPLSTQHDAAEPLGFLVKHEELGSLLFATDTYYLRDRFSGLNHVLIECNYSMAILEENIAAGRIDRAVRDRVINSHMELETCKKFLEANELSYVNTIVLLHLSRQNGNAEAFVSEITRQTGKIAYIAQKGLEIEMCKDLV